MTSIIKNTAIIAGILAIIAYAIYRYVKRGKISKPISYEDIVNVAVSKVRESNNVGEVYELIIIPPSKAILFISENPDFLENVSLKDVKDKQLVIWYLQCSDKVIAQEAMISDTLAQDFLDVVPADKIYRKVIKLKNQ
ncbi:MAG: hypothetical protein J6C31_05320 [Prevotella sp.]|nr:hypothetical protein [Prevotella sp.]